MTLVIAWVRKVANREELVVAADSRLRSNGAWDACPKIFRLERGDATISFCGHTHYAYPLIIQLVNLIKYNPKIEDRALGLSALVGHLLRVTNKMLKYEKDVRVKDDLPDFELMISGYCCIKDSFIVSILKYDQKKKKIVKEKQKYVQGNTVGILGENHKEVRKILNSIMAKKEEKVFDYEPIDVLQNFIDDESESTCGVGGKIQLNKVYKHLTTKPYIVIHNNELSLDGRVLLDYEKPLFNLFDISTKKMFRWEEKIDEFPRINED